MCAARHASGNVPAGLAIGNNYFIQADGAGPMLEEWTTKTIASLRRGAADEENHPNFRAMLANMADQLEAEMNSDPSN